jgi:hypothetical protein
MVADSDIAELERLLDRLLLGEGTDESENRVMLAGDVLGRALLAGSPDPSSSALDEAAFQRCVVIAAATALLQHRQLANDGPEARDAGIAQLVLSAECRRLRQQLGRTQLDAAQWRDRALASRNCDAVDIEPRTDRSVADLPWSKHQEEQRCQRIAFLIGEFKRSWHWHIGHAVVTLAERLLGRSGKPTALDAAEALARSELP